MQLLLYSQLQAIQKWLNLFVCHHNNGLISILEDILILIFESSVPLQGSGGNGTRV